MNESYVWDLWIAAVGSMGVAFARGLSQPAQEILVHAAPQQLNVEVRTATGRVVARGQDLMRSADTPMSRLRIEGEQVVREDAWPTERDYGSLVILPGGEVGVLQKWWNAEDHHAWRWNVEFYNSRS